MAKPSWYMSHYTMIYKNGERMRDFLGLFGFICNLVFYILGAFLIKQLFHPRLFDMRCESAPRKRFVDSLRQRASTRNVSSRISLRWPIHIISSVHSQKFRTMRGVTYVATFNVVIGSWLSRKQVTPAPLPRASKL